MLERLAKNFDHQKDRLHEAVGADPSEIREILEELSKHNFKYKTYDVLYILDSDISDYTKLFLLLNLERLWLYQKTQYFNSRLFGDAIFPEPSEAYIQPPQKANKKGFLTKELFELSEENPGAFSGTLMDFFGLKEKEFKTHIQKLSEKIEGYLKPSQVVEKILTAEAVDAEKLVTVIHFSSLMEMLVGHSRDDDDGEEDFLYGSL